MTDDRAPLRRRGRPRAEPSVSVTVRLPLQIYDAYAQLAIRRGESVSHILRELMRRHVPDLTSNAAAAAARARVSRSARGFSS
jgi:hypothetical protein